MRAMEHPVAVTARRSGTPATSPAQMIDLTRPAPGRLAAEAVEWLIAAAALPDPARTPPAVPPGLAALRTPASMVELTWSRPAVIGRLGEAGVRAGRADELWDLLVWWIAAHSEAAQRSELELLARTDPLTGLLNRRGLEEALERETARARRTDGAVCLVLIDLDSFKTLNDTLGHPAGDAALCDIGDLLNRGLRTNDVAGRWGGDEFAVVFSGLSQDGAREVVDRLRSTLNHPSNRRRSKARIAFSAGVAALGGREAAQGRLMQLADAALYQAKAAGGGRTVISG
jgi:diguanylate cyclase (GGDEF)-like protein